MSMKSHEDFARNNAAEKYTLGQLSEKEEVSFEEHLLFCDVCRKEVQEHNQIKEVVTKYAIVSDHVLSIETKKTPRVRSIGFFSRIAASILVIIGISWFVLAHLGIKNNKHENQMVHTQNLIKNRTETNVLNKDSVKGNLMAKNDQNNFTELLRFESQINQEYRSDAIEIISPKKPEMYKSSENINFQWKKSAIEKLILGLYDNKGKLIFQEKITSNFHFKQVLPPGLYYWQLETEDDIVYTGKFSVLNTK